MTHTWEHLEGVSLAGEYGLEQWLGSDPSGAWFTTSFGPDRVPAVVKLTEENPSTAETQLAMWQRTSRLSHPSLMALRDCGRAHSRDEWFLYAVFEAPDDSLSATLENRLLSKEEARDVLASVVDALQYLHVRGWAHTSIDTEHVVAVGDRIKLASDTLSDLGEIRTAQRDDVWALGALIYELLTARRIAPGQLADVSEIAEPLATLIQHAVEPDVDFRWTAGQLAAALSGNPPAAIAPFEPAPATPDEDRQTSLFSESWDDAEPAAVDVDEAGQPPAHDEESASYPEDAETEPEPAPRPPSIVVHEPFSIMGSEEPAAVEAPPNEPTFARYVPIAAVALVALLVIVFVIAQRGTPTPPAVAIVPPAEPAASVIPAAPNALQSWRVIAYTFARYEDAEKRAQSINTRTPDIHAEVFTLGSSPPSYLISLGGRMTREDAAALRKRALAKGLPRDTFIRNFSN